MESEHSNTILLSVVAIVAIVALVVLIMGTSKTVYMPSTSDDTLEYDDNKIATDLTGMAYEKCPQGYPAGKKGFDFPSQHVTISITPLKKIPNDATDKEKAKLEAANAEIQAKNDKKIMDTKKRMFLALFNQFKEDIKNKIEEWSDQEVEQYKQICLKQSISLLGQCKHKPPPVSPVTPTFHCTYEGLTTDPHTIKHAQMVSATCTTSADIIENPSGKEVTITVTIVAKAKTTNQICYAGNLRHAPPVTASNSNAQDLAVLTTYGQEESYGESSTSLSNSEAGTSSNTVNSDQALIISTTSDPELTASTVTI